MAGWQWWWSSQDHPAGTTGGKRGQGQAEHGAQGVAPRLACWPLLTYLRSLVQPPPSSLVPFPKYPWVPRWGLVPRGGPRPARKLPC